jgi:hypothetical protein
MKKRGKGKSGWIWLGESRAIHSRLGFNRALKLVFKLLARFFKGFLVDQLIQFHFMYHVNGQIKRSSCPQFPLLPTETLLRHNYFLNKASFKLSARTEARGNFIRCRCTLRLMQCDVSIRIKNDLFLHNTKWLHFACKITRLQTTETDVLE